MTRAEKARRIQETLQRLYPLPEIPLRHRDPYTLLIAVVLSAQCTDRRVNEVTPRLFGQARTPAGMVRLGVRAIERIIRPCGLAPAKARNIHALSKILVERHGGRVPASMEALEALPGVGHKTASVVMAQAFGHATFPVDTHIHRLAARWGLSDGSRVEQTERDLMRAFPRSEWRRLHLQIIYFGRARCPARGHDLSACPICSWAASRARIAEEARRLPGGASVRGGAAGRSRRRPAAKKNGAGRRRSARRPRARAGSGVDPKANGAARKRSDAPGGGSTGDRLERPHGAGGRRARRSAP